MESLIHDCAMFRNGAYTGDDLKDRTKRNTFIRETILSAPELIEKIYGKNIGIRHRLAHGDYVMNASQEDYFIPVYNKVIEYFNHKIIGENLISAVVSPLRHPFGNILYSRFYLRATGDKELDLRSIMDACERGDGIDNIEGYQMADAPSEY